MRPETEPLIVRDPSIRFGKPTISGTRVTVANVLRVAARGLSTKQILEEFPHLTEAAIAAAMEFAADALDEEWLKTRPEGHYDWLADSPEWHVVGEELG